MTFKYFYVNLYSCQVVDTHKLVNFLEGLDILGVEEETWESLEADITKQEVLKAIGKLSAGKSPGPGGFSTVWTFIKHLPPI